VQEQKSIQLKKGDRVRNLLAPDWSLGQLLEDGVADKARVFFVGAGERRVLLSPMHAQRVQGAEAESALLDNLRVDGNGRFKAYRTLFELIDAFLKVYPGGFQGEEYREEERAYKVEAHELLAQCLGERECKSLLMRGQFGEVCRRARQVVNKTNLVFPNEKMALKDGLRAAGAEELFATKLHSLLYGDDTPEARFTAFAECLGEIQAAKWTIATYFLFMADPNHHMFLKPTVTQQAADICAFELNYRPEINWLTYSCLLRFANYLRSALRDLSPTDMIDVQSFIWKSAGD
jgi:hypothetical protein